MRETNNIIMLLNSFCGQLYISLICPVLIFKDRKFSTKQVILFVQSHCISYDL